MKRVEIIRHVIISSIQIIEMTTNSLIRLMKIRLKIPWFGLAHQFFLPISKFLFSKFATKERIFRFECSAIMKITSVYIWKIAYSTLLWWTTFCFKCVRGVYVCVMTLFIRIALKLSIFHNEKCIQMLCVYACFLCMSLMIVHSTLYLTLAQNTHMNSKYT